MLPVFFSVPRSISGNMRWSYQARMKKGTFLPAAMPFGYRIEGRKIVIDEERVSRQSAAFRAKREMDLTRILSTRPLRQSERSRWKSGRFCADDRRNHHFLLSFTTLFP